MKKAVVAVVAAVVLMGTLLGAGCKIDPSTVPVIAQSAGLFSAVGWIAIDNPTGKEIAAVKSTLDIIEEKAADVTGGATYTEVIYPEVAKFIDKDLAEQYRPIAKAGAVSLLGGIDLLFASHPEWKKDQETVIKVVDGFIFGAKSGLGMKESHPLMKQARANSAARARIYRK